MLKERHNVLKNVILGVDMLIITLVFFGTFLLRQHFSTIYTLDIFPAVQVVKEANLSASDYMLMYFYIIMSWMTTLSFNGMYQSVHYPSVLEVARIIIKSALMVTIVFSTFVFLFKLQFVSRLFFVIFILLTVLFLMAEKTILYFTMRHWVQQGYHLDRVCIVGSGKRARKLVTRIQKHPEWGYKVVKVVDIRQCLIEEHQPFGECEVVNSALEMQRIFQSNPIDHVVFVVPRTFLPLIEEYLYVCENEGVNAAIATDLFDFPNARPRHTDLDGIPLITFEKRFDKEWQLFLKRCVDIIVSGVVIIILSPLLIVSALLIKITSPGPVFFRQLRVSLHGRKFTMLKFRSMHQEAEAMLKELRSLNEAEGPIFKMKSDPRVTPVGRWLRKFSIDELPQLFNVFTGMMSLVGPRPALPYEVERYEPWQRKRLSVRPGITCLWQVYHRGESDFEKWMRCDLDYIEQWSLWLDCKIFIKTILVVVSGKGAY